MWQYWEVQMTVVFIIFQILAQCMYHDRNITTDHLDLHLHWSFLEKLGAPALLMKIVQ